MCRRDFVITQTTQTNPQTTQTSLSFIQLYIERAILIWIYFSFISYEIKWYFHIVRSIQGIKANSQPGNLTTPIWRLTVQTAQQVSMRHIKLTVEKEYNTASLFTLPIIIENHCAFTSLIKLSKISASYMQLSLFAFLLLVRLINEGLGQFCSVLPRLWLAIV